MVSAVKPFQITDTQFHQAIDQLTQFVAIPSVSHPTSPYYNMDTLQKAADFATKLLKEIGFEARQVFIKDPIENPTEDSSSDEASAKVSAPFILAEKIVDPSKPTVLLYAHYDLQPVDEDKWETQPFVLTEREGRLYGRGASDDKAGIITIITALGALLKQYGTLPVNVKILFEGEEEYGSTHMEPLLKQEGDNFKADALVIMDCGNKDVHTGTLCTSVRGVVNLTMEVKTMEQPIHSGVGCLARDPGMLLAKLIRSLEDPSEIPGFMDGCEELKDAEREILRKDSQTAKEYAKELKLVGGEAKRLRGDSDLSVYERIAETPSISLINGGWGKPKGGNSIQEAARCEIGIRITAGQDPDKAASAVKAHLLAQAKLMEIPVEIQQPEPGCFPWKGDLSGPLTKKYLAALKEVFGKTHAQPSGGGLPLLHTFQATQPKMEMILPGIEDPDTNAHSHNESQDKGLFRRAINSLIGFLVKAGEK